MLKEEAGCIRLDGKPLKPKERQRLCYLVMQDVNHQLFGDSVSEECEQAAGETGISEIDGILELFDLSDLKEQHPMALSGGQKQRLAVATALLSGRKVLIFDEPTSGLDYKQMKNVCRVMHMLADRGCIVIVVTHDKEFMKEACDRELTLVCRSATCGKMFTEK